jgi:hypothetical protein
MSSQITTQPRTIRPTLTGAGVMAAINVPKTGIEVAVTHIAFGTGKYRPSGAEIGLQHEMMRVAIAGGGKVSPTQIQVHAEAIAPIGSPFWCGEIGFYAGDTLFAVYSKPDQPILYFADDSVTTVSYTLGLTALPADSVTVLVDPNVNTAIQLIGAHETAGDPHPQYLTKPRADVLYFGRLTAYTNSDTDCDTLLETGARDVSVANDRGVIAATKLPAGADGYGTLITTNGGQFVRQVYSEAGTTRRTWARTGYLGSATPFDGRPWKLLWDSENFDPSSKQDKLGFMPVQQGTGHGQKSNTVKMGWSGDSLKVTVDDTDFGAVIFQANLEAALKSYLPLAGGSVTGLLQVSGSTGAIGSLGAGRPGIEIASIGKSDDAYITFHKPGAFATHLGLDANNDLVVGGYSMGANAYKLWHAGNFNPTTKQDALGYRPPQAVGAWLNSVIVDDSRAKYYAPKDRDMGIYFDFRNNDAGNLADGGVQHGVITFRQWGVGEDFSGGPLHQLGFTANGNLFHRTGSGSAWEKYQRLLHAGQNGTLPDDTLPTLADMNKPSLGWAIYTQEATANRPSAYGIVFTSSLTGSTLPDGNWLLQRVLTTENGSITRVNTGGGWSAWAQSWTSINFDPGSKATGPGYNMQWSGQGGQPTWLIGGEAPGTIYVYNPSNFDVRSARSAGTSTNAENISNGNSYMRLAWSDPGGQPTYLWGSDGPTSARLAVIGNLSVGHAREADNATKVGGVPMRFAENPNEQAYYIYGVVAGRVEMTLFNRSSMAVGSAVNASYANQLSGQGLGYGGIGGYILNKRKDGTGLAGIWEQRGQVYDYGSGAVEGNESSSVLWQRVA